MVLLTLLQCGIAEVVFEERAVYFQVWVAYFICITLSRVPIFLCPYFISQELLKLKFKNIQRTALDRNFTLYGGT